jgi:cytidylate kinase
MSEAEAMKEVKASDRDRADYLKRFYEIDVEQPTHYDLVLNTDRLTPEETANVVAAAAAA